jgi:REP element-mobilizing transposase RayT
VRTINPQIALPGFQFSSAKTFGGSTLKGNAREQRPISVKRPMHVVMRSSLATNEHSFLKPQRARRIETLVRRIGKAKGVKVYRYANAGNHLHLVVLPRSRESFHAFTRAISGVIARLTLGVERGRAQGKKFWDAKPFTRILEWGRDFKTTVSYVLQNKLEALGFIPYQKRSSSQNPPVRRSKKPDG